MKLKEAQYQLTLARKRLRKTMKEIAALMAFIGENGGDPRGRPDQSIRDERIYKLRQNGASAREIALQYKLSTDRVRAIYNKIRSQRKRRVK